MLKGRNKGGRIDCAEWEVARDRQVPLKRSKRGFDLLELIETVEWPHRLNPTTVRSSGDPVHLVEGVVAILGLPKETGHRIECEAEAVAAAIRKNLADVRDNVTQL